jgi:Mrp family chromosome partitioning ATPase
LTSSGFHALLDELKQEFTYIVMDAPPILAVSDATVLGHLADSIIVAVKAESTTHEMLAETLSRLRKSGVDATGAVLCQAEPRRMAEYASYYDANYAHYYAYNSDKVAAADHAMEAITGVATARDSQPDLAAEGDTGHGRRPFAQKAERQGTDRNERPFGQKAG